MTRPINIENLDRSLVDNRKLKTFDDMVWFSYGRRRYERNSNGRGYVFAQLFFFIFVIGAIAFFEYFPFKFFGFMFLIVVNTIAIGMPIKYANKSAYLIWVNVVVGAIGLLTSVHFGLTIFHFHLERYLFWVYVVGGILACYRRLWNHIIWKKLDKIVLQYYCDNDLL